MTDANLGGRLPLLVPGALNAEQRALANRLHATWVPWADAAGFESTLADGRVIGPFNPVLLSPAISSSFLDLQDVERMSTSLEAAVREVVILTVGAIWKCAYELYAHCAVGRAVGLSEDVVRALAAGEAPIGLTLHESLAQRFTRQLAAEHRIDEGLYREAEEAFGRHGLVDLISLIGIYQQVCALLNAFEVPAPEPRAATCATVTPIAAFPVDTFLENLVARRDDSLLVSSLRPQALWYVPPGGDAVSAPQLLHAFPQNVMGLVELEPDVFIVVTSNVYTTHESALSRLDLRGWTPGTAVRVEPVVQFPKAARMLNGCTLIAQHVLIVADSTGRLWRVDVHPDGRASISIWLEHPSMEMRPGEMKPEQPGVNGVRFAPRSGYLYYTSTAQRLFVRIAVDPGTQRPFGEPEIVAGGTMADDFCIDEDGGVAYLTTHRQNTIDRVALNPAENAGRRFSVAGSPLDLKLLGPSSAVWSRTALVANRVAFVTSDGGTTAPPPDGIVRPARVLRVEFPPLG